MLCRKRLLARSYSFCKLASVSADKDCAFRISLSTLPNVAVGICLTSLAVASTASKMFSQASSPAVADHYRQPCPAERRPGQRKSEGGSVLETSPPPDFRLMRAGHGRDDRWHPTPRQFCRLPATDYRIFPLPPRSVGMEISEKG
jgi:hypothetical protein